MKRVKAACICQTLHFMCKEDLDHALAVRQVEKEWKQYLEGLDRSRTAYRIVGELPQSDGSLVVKIIKQYNRSPVGDYLQ